MRIKQGGNTQNFKGNYINTIRISYIKGKKTFELWINEDSLSYLSIEELLDLKNEIQLVLKEYIK